MNILIVTAHPSRQGFTHQIAERYKKGATEAGHTVEVLDLYKTPLQQDFFAYEKIKEIPENKAQIEIQKKITWANELVFAFPMWWFSYPAILKNFFDWNFSSGFAYKWEKTNGRARLRRLLKGKTARVFITCDGHWLMYALLMTPKIALKYGTLLFCGIKTKSWMVFGKMLYSDSQKREKWLERVERMGGKRSWKNG